MYNICFKLYIVKLIFLMFLIYSLKFVKVLLFLFNLLNDIKFSSDEYISYIFLYFNGIGNSRGFLTNSSYLKLNEFNKLNSTPPPSSFFSSLISFVNNLLFFICSIIDFVFSLIFTFSFVDLFNLFNKSNLIILLDGFSSSFNLYLIYLKYYRSYILF